MTLRGNSSINFVTFGPTLYPVIREIFSARDITSKLFVESAVHCRCQTGKRVVTLLDISHGVSISVILLFLRLKIIREYFYLSRPMGIDLEKLLRSYLGYVVSMHWNIRFGVLLPAIPISDICAMNT